MNIEELIKEYKLTEEKLWEIKRQIRNTSDGFIYMTKLRRWGSISWETHNNEFSVQELCDEFNGDNGIVDVYTNNPDHKISSYGDVEVMTLEEMKEMSKENISMSRAMLNWVVK